MGKIINYFLSACLLSPYCVLEVNARKNGNSTNKPINMSTLFAEPGDSTETDPNATVADSSVTDTNSTPTDTETELAEVTSQEADINDQLTETNNKKADVKAQISAQQKIVEAEKIENAKSELTKLEERITASKSELSSLEQKRIELRKQLGLPDEVAPAVTPATAIAAAGFGGLFATLGNKVVANIEAKSGTITDKITNTVSGNAAVTDASQALDATGNVPDSVVDSGVDQAADYSGNTDTDAGN